MEPIVFDPGIPIWLFDVARPYGARAFVETGTFNGASVGKAIAYFDEIWSCELNEENARGSQAAFASFGHVHIENEDSRTFLPRVLADLQQRGLRALVWLDAHFSGNGKFGPTAGKDNCPLLEELPAFAAITELPPVVAIDDAADMDGTTLPTVYEITKQFRSGTQVVYAFRVCPELRRGVLLCLPEK